MHGCQGTTAQATAVLLLAPWCATRHSHGFQATVSYPPRSSHCYCYWYTTRVITAFYCTYSSYSHQYCQTAMYVLPKPPLCCSCHHGIAYCSSSAFLLRFGVATCAYIDQQQQHFSNTETQPEAMNSRTAPNVHLSLLVYHYESIRICYLLYTWYVILLYFHNFVENIYAPVV